MIATESNVLNQRVEVSLHWYNSLRLCSVGNHALDFSTSSKLTVSASAKEEKLFPWSNDTSVATTTDNFINWLIEAEFSWLSQVLTILMPKLSIISVTPGIDLSLVG